MRFGFEEIAYQGLETGNRDIVKHVVRKNDITFVFASALNPGHEEVPMAIEREHSDTI